MRLFGPILALAASAALLLACGGGVTRVSANPACNVVLSNITLAVNEAYTLECNHPDPIASSYAVWANTSFAVYYTAGSYCRAVNFIYFNPWSVVGAAAGTTARVDMMYADRAANFDPSFLPLCIRIKNVDPLNRTMSANVTFEWYPISYDNQWHLRNTGQYQHTNPLVTGADANLVPAWNAGYNGSGVIIDIVDDGLQANHVEISPRFRLDLSYNFQTDVLNPTGLVTDTHGTACGGVAAAENNNNYCGTGAAFGAQLAGHRILFSNPTVADYIAALYTPSIATDISSNSWGPAGGCSTLGCTFFTANAQIVQAIADGFVMGRNGLGRPYVFAAGNEGYYGGDANQYTYTKLREVITVAGSSYLGERVYYSNAGVCLFVNAPTQGSTGAQVLFPGIITAAGGSGTTDCTDGFGGTSSSTPLVSGIIALIMHANPMVSARDVQHILRATATKNDPTHPSWFTNGAGIPYSRIYGFGRVNAGAAVAMAANPAWTTVAPVWKYATAAMTNAGTITAGSAGVTRSFNASSWSTTVKYIEHVTLQVTATFFNYTDLKVQLTSPAGTQVDVVLPTRPRTTSNNWGALYSFGIRAFWGETGFGVWTLTVSAPLPAVGSGTFTRWQLTVYGLNPNAPPPVSSSGLPLSSSAQLFSSSAEKLSSSAAPLISSSAAPVISSSADAATPISSSAGSVVASSAAPLTPTAVPTAAEPTSTGAGAATGSNDGPTGLSGAHVTSPVAWLVLPVCLAAAVVVAVNV